MAILFKDILDEALTILENLEKRLPGLIKQYDKLKNDKLPNGRPRYPILKFGSLAGDPEKVIRYLAEHDPSGSANNPKGENVSWILKQAASGSIKLPEDSDQLIQALTIFGEYKKSKRFKGHKEINKYKSYPQLLQATSEFRSLGQQKVPSSLRGWIKSMESHYEVFYQDEMLTVLKFEDNGEKREIVASMKSIEKDGYSVDANWVPTWSISKEELAQIRKRESSFHKLIGEVSPGAVAVSRATTGSKWCTANPLTAQSVYLSKGPLYLIYKKGQKYLLANYNWSEFHNVDNLAYKTMTPFMAYGLSLMLLNKTNELEPSELKRIASYIYNCAIQATRTRRVSGQSGGRGVTPAPANAFPEEEYNIIKSALEVAGYDIGN